MDINELEKRLDEAKKQFINHEFKECKDFPGYEISIHGQVKSLAKVIKKPCPRNVKKKWNYFFKEKILQHLHTGIDRRWTTVILSTPERRKQISVAKLMISTFLDISLEDLPRQIFFIDGDSTNIVLNNLTFIRKKKKVEL